MECVPIGHLPSALDPEGQYDPTVEHKVGATEPVGSLQYEPEVRICETLAINPHEEIMEQTSRAGRGTHSHGGRAAILSSRTC